MASFWIHIVVRFSLCRSLIPIIGHVITGGQIIHNTSDLPPPKEPEYALQINNGHEIIQFSIGFTYQEPDTHRIIGVTSGYNLCHQPSSSIYGFKTRNTLNDVAISTPPYNYDSSINNCATFIVNKSGLNHTIHTMDNFDGYKVYDDPPPKYQVEKIGASTGHTIGYIMGSVQSKILPAPTGCNETAIPYPTLWIVETKDDSNFSEAGDSGSVVYNSMDKTIIGFVVGVQIAGGDNDSSYVAPYSAWERDCHLPSFSEYEDSSTSKLGELSYAYLFYGVSGLALTLIIILIIMCAKVLQFRRASREKIRLLLNQAEDETIPFTEINV